ncbi:MAG: hypothetical protein JWN44_7131 [Myxococcales bacterium]|nr:hypothetical protein [Myxococcales bacterium]
MLGPLFAALACVTSPPAAQSLPLDAGPVSVAVDSMSTMPAMSPGFDAGDADAMTPMAVECEATASTPAPMLAASDCSSAWVADMIGTCDLPRASHSRAATLRRARGPLAGFGVAGGRIGEGAELIVPDSQSSPALLAARLQLLPAPLSSLLALAALADPPAAPSRRLDRPPRA